MVNVKRNELPIHSNVARGKSLSLTFCPRTAMEDNFGSEYIQSDTYSSVRVTLLACSHVPTHILPHSCKKYCFN